MRCCASWYCRTTICNAPGLDVQCWWKTKKMNINILIAKGGDLSPFSPPWLRLCLLWMGLLWTWSVLNGLLWVVCYERVCFECELFWSMVMLLWVTSFKLLTVMGSGQKPPHSEGGGSNCIRCNDFYLKNKNVNYRKWFWSFQDEWKP